MDEDLNHHMHEDIKRGSAHLPPEGDATADDAASLEASQSGGLSLPPRKKLGRNLLLLLFVGVALYFFLPRVAAMEHALEVLSRLNMGFVMLAIAAQTVSYLGCGYLLRSVVREPLNRVSVLDGVLVTLAANSVGTLGGGVLGTAGMSYLWMRHRGVNRGMAGLGGWIPIFLNLVVLAVVSLGGLVVLIHLKKSSTVLATGLGLVTLVMVGALGGLGWLLTHRDKLHVMATATAGFTAKIRRKPIDLHKIEISVRQLLDGWDTLVRGGWRGPALGAIINTGGDMLTLSFLFMAAGAHVNVALLLAGYGVPQLAGKLTVIMGGAGVVETGMVALYVLVGVPNATAVVAVLGYRLFSFWLPTLLGIGLVPFLGMREQRKERS